MMASFFLPAIVPSMDIKSWDIQNVFIVYQTFALSQIVRLTIVTLTLSCKIKIISNLSVEFQSFFVTYLF
jgi:hypothetical protein